MSNYLIEPGCYGPRIVLTGAWSDSIATALAGIHVAELELNYAKGWRGKDLSFLLRFQELKAFKIIDYAIQSVEPVHVLNKLQRLEVMTYCKTELDFTSFPGLDFCALQWRPKAASLFNCYSIQSLFLVGYSGKDCELFRGLLNLESLSIYSAPISNLFGLSGLGKLRTLRLANLRRLESLSGIENLTQLEELDVHTCKAIGNIDAVASLSHLRRLLLNNCGKIASLRPLEGLRDLDTLIFYESTDIVDGDLSGVFGRRPLPKMSFQNRKHYSHRREQLDSYNNLGQGGNGVGP